MLFIIFNSCESSIKNQSHHLEISKMNYFYTLKEFPTTTKISSILRLEWRKDIPDFLVSAPSFGIGQINNYKIRSEIRFKLTDNNCKIILLPDNTMSVFDSQNQLLSSLRISPHFKDVENWKIIDFTMDEIGNKYVIEQYRLEQNTSYIYIARKFDLDNTLQGVIDNITENTLLIPYNKQVYIVSNRNDKTTLFKANFHTEKLKSIHHFNFKAKHTFVSDNTLCLIDTLNQNNQVIKYDLQTSQITSYITDSNIGVPLGLDNNGNYYTAQGRTFKSLNLNTKVLKEEKIFNIIFDEKQRKYYLSFLDESKSKLNIFSINEKQTFTTSVDIISLNNSLVCP